LHFRIELLRTLSAGLSAQNDTFREFYLSFASLFTGGKTNNDTKSRSDALIQQWQ
jgi:hypothetical protein